MVLSATRGFVVPTRLAVVDIPTGAVLQTLEIGNHSVNDVEIVGDVLHMLATNSLITVDLRVTVGGLAVAAVVPTPAGFNTQLSIGKATAYLNHGSGIDTFDLTDPLNPTFVAHNDSAIPWSEFRRTLSCSSL